MRLTFDFGTELNQEYFDPLVEKKILIGPCNRLAYKQPPYLHWFDKWYEKQEPELYHLNKIDKKRLASLQILIFTASWCGVCRTEITRFYKIMDLLHVPLDNTQIIYLDRTKKLPEKDIAPFRVQRVPTFVFFDKGVEIARIIEQPKDSLEAHIFMILQS